MKGVLLRSVLLAALAAGLVLTTAGCGYCKNVRDDFMDIGTMAVGITPPVLYDSDSGKQAVLGFLPPCIGVYGQVTSFLQVGALFKASADATWDRRGLGIIVDRRVKFGVGPWHYVRIDEEPIFADAYKMPESRMDQWRQHMAEMQDPIFGASAKTMVFDGESGPQPYLADGWQDWQIISLEVAVPEPLLTHSGLYLRVGFDISQAFDAVLSLVFLDLYNDRAYKINGELLYGSVPAGIATGGAMDSFFE